ALARWRERVAAEPGNAVAQSHLAWTHGQIGAAEQVRFDYGAAVQEYAKSVEMFETLDMSGALKDPFFRGLFDRYRRQLVLCQKAEQAVKDLDFALKQPAAEVPGLLNLRLQVLTAKKDLPGVSATATAFAKLAEKDEKQIYDAACAWSLAAGIAQTRGADAA